MDASSLASPWWLYFFLVAGIVALPGMDMAFVLASTLAQGRRAGLAAVAGLACGGAAHVALGALGVGVVLASAPGLFNALLAAGALYIGWIGLQLWRAAAALGAPDALPDAPRRSARQTFARALATCLMNPKAYLFTLAVFPQFLRPGQGSLPAQALVMAVITMGTQVLIYGAVAWGAAQLRGRLQANSQAQVQLARAVATLLVLTAAWTLWQGWRG